VLLDQRSYRLGGRAQPVGIAVGKVGFGSALFTVARITNPRLGLGLRINILKRCLSGETRSVDARSGNDD